MEYQIPLYPRNIYLDKITPFREDCGRIKVLTGVRRCGNSSIMELVRRQLLAEGVSAQNLLFLNLDSGSYNKDGIPPIIKKYRITIRNISSPWTIFFSSGTELST